MPADAIPIAAIAKKDDGASLCAHDAPLSLKSAVYLFLIIILIFSGSFTQAVTTYIPNAVLGRQLTTWGYMMHAVFVVVCYAATTYLIQTGVF